MDIVKTTEAVGLILCQDMTQIIKDEFKGPRFKKGHVVQEEDIPVLLSMGKEHLYVWKDDVNMVHENQGAQVLYDLCAGSHMHGTEVKEGKVELVADCDGLLKVDTQKLNALNSLGEIMIATRHGNTVVKKGDKLAGTRIIPLAIERDKLDRAVTLAGEEPVLDIKPFEKKKIALIALINTLVMTFITLLVAVPLGVFSAIYLEEYAKRGNKLVKLVAITTETLSGIPSIVYGIFGLLFFVTTLGWGYSMLAGAFTLAIMILPTIMRTIMRTTQEALKAVPDSYREGSFGLGAGRLRTVFCIILPAASPGIFSGIVLAVGRIVGETAALIYTAGTVAQIPPNLMGSGRTLAIHMYALWSEGLYTNQSYATAVVLLIIVVCLNLLSDKIAKGINQYSN